MTAICNKYPDVGYRAGMAFLASHCLHDLDALTTFRVLAHTLDGAKFRARFFQEKLPQAISLLHHLIRIHLPAVVVNEQTLVHIFPGWFMTCLVRSPLPATIKDRIVACYLWEGAPAVYKVILAIVKRWPVVFQSEAEDMMPHLQAMEVALQAGDAEGDDLMAIASRFDVTEEAIEAWVKQHVM
jgi:hypothetical protein